MYTTNGFSFLYPKRYTFPSIYGTFQLIYRRVVYRFQFKELNVFNLAKVSLNRKDQNLNSFWNYSLYQYSTLLEILIYET